MRALLDVNVLVALLDAGHLHHRVATAWLDKHHREGWASCPLTQNGCVRILSLPGYPNAQAPGTVATRLAEAVQDTGHAFWPDSISLLAPPRLKWDRVLGSRQVTDLYLLALAVENSGRVVTFDRGIPVDAVAKATQRHLVTLQ